MGELCTYCYDKAVFEMNDGNPRWVPICRHHKVIFSNPFYSGRALRKFRELRKMVLD